MKRASLLFLALTVPFAVYACSSDDTTTTPSGSADSGTSGDAAGGTDAPASSDAGPTDSGSSSDTGQDANVPVTCSDSDFVAVAVDGGDAGGAVVTFPTGASPAQYTNRCVLIKAGQTVSFQGSFSDHPLQAHGGDSPSPIPALTSTTPDAGALVVTFPSAGTFGFRCQFHPTLMNGAVKVVP